jgi:hypothetical protein
MFLLFCCSWMTHSAELLQAWMTATGEEEEHLQQM